ncbi:hypothetical protein [Cryobacterium sp. Sr3]|uniref:hypothetical protein n=1 Tax=Cryobacterium sp. Sr3 TaxID=1259194 RepID=UPI00106CED21|nr:hypothetical protein [Cryobacterium sp. Sr3]TFB59632.1 hypothetical protein E3N94_03235 [Cryobacterium sp. Sr3]
MADVRKSAKQTAARSRAREKAAEFRAKEDKLEQLATDYFVATDSLDDIVATAQADIAAIQERAEKQSAAARTVAATVIASMLELGTPKSEVADRLGLPPREVKRSPATPR